MDRTPSTQTTRRGPRRRLPENHVQINVRLAPDDKGWLDAHADAADMTVAAVIRRWIKIARGRQQGNILADIDTSPALSLADGAATEPRRDH